MLDRVADQYVSPSEELESADPPPVRLMHRDAFIHKLGDLIPAAMRRARADPDLIAAVAKKMRCRTFLEALVEGIDACEATVVLDPRNTAHYGGIREDGNPITFFFRHYQLPIEAGAYYQSDLQRDNPPLFHAVRNSLRAANWQDILDEADKQLLKEKLSPHIRGVRIRDIRELADLIPARRGIVSRRPDPRGRRRPRPTALAAE